jgi:hypothetical protein
MNIQAKSPPIFNPIQGLADALLARGVDVAPVRHTDGVGVRVASMMQLHCNSQEDFPALADQIAKLGKAVRFATPHIPRMGVIAVQTYQYGHISARYVAAYSINTRDPVGHTDKVIGRWDVLVEAV